MEIHVFQKKISAGKWSQKRYRQIRDIQSSSIFSILRNYFIWWNLQNLPATIRAIICYFSGEWKENTTGFFHFSAENQPSYTGKCSTLFPEKFKNWGRPSQV